MRLLRQPLPGKWKGIAFHFPGVDSKKTLAAHRVQTGTAFDRISSFDAFSLSSGRGIIREFLRGSARESG